MRIFSQYFYHFFVKHLWHFHVTTEINFHSSTIYNNNISRSFPKQITMLCNGIKHHSVSLLYMLSTLFQHYEIIIWSFSLTKEIYWLCITKCHDSVCIFCGMFQALYQTLHTLLFKYHCSQACRVAAVKLHLTKCLLGTIIRFPQSLTWHVHSQVMGQWSIVPYYQQYIHNKSKYTITELIYYFN